MTMTGTAMGQGTADEDAYVIRDGRSRCECGRRLPGPDLFGTFVDYMAAVLDRFGLDLANWPDIALHDAMEVLFADDGPAELIFERKACDCGCTPALRVDLVELLKAGVKCDDA